MPRSQRPTLAVRAQHHMLPPSARAQPKPPPASLGRANGPLRARATERAWHGATGVQPRTRHDSRGSCRAAPPVLGPNTFPHGVRGAAYALKAKSLGHPHFFGGWANEATASSWPGGRATSFRQRVAMRIAFGRSARPEANGASSGDNGDAATSRSTTTALPKRWKSPRPPGAAPPWAFYESNFLRACGVAAASMASRTMVSRDMIAGAHDGNAAHERRRVP